HHFRRENEAYFTRLFFYVNNKLDQNNQTVSLQSLWVYFALILGLLPLPLNDFLCASLARRTTNPAKTHLTMDRLTFILPDVRKSLPQLGTVGTHSDSTRTVRLSLIPRLKSRMRAFCEQQMMDANKTLA
ncbi:hypothetical protein VII00023_08749, partial [Vibrio ichthyoenteri ATCC 700023]